MKHRFVPLPFVVSLLLMIHGPTPASAAGKDASNAETARDRAMERLFGVQLKGVRLASAGYMLDFRYHVTDAEKAKPLFDRRNPAILIDQETGAKMMVPVPPKTGALRSTRPPKAGRTYFMFFANPGQFVKAGQKVTVTIGEFKAEGLVVME